MTATTMRKPAAKAVAWAAMEPLYRAGIVPLAQLSRDFGVSRAAIHKHAAKHGWIRALEALPSSAGTAEAPAWRDAARKTLDQLSDLLVGCYEVVNHTEQFEPLNAPTLEASEAVGIFAAEDDLHDRARFQDLMHLVRDRITGAVAAAASMQLPAWNVLAREILRVIEAAQPADGSFLRGRDLAIGMLRAGDELHGDGSVEALRRHRDGREQNRFVRGPLQELIRHPELLEGFAAVLSGRLGVAEPLKAHEFDLPLAEYQPGVPGADGTRPSDDDAPPCEADAVKEVARATPEPHESVTGADASTSQDEPDDRDARRRLACDANYQIGRMAEGMTRLLEMKSTEETTMYYGMLARIQQLSEIVFHAARLHGDDADAMSENDDLRALQRKFKGML